MVSEEIFIKWNKILKESLKIKLNSFYKKNVPNNCYFKTTDGELNNNHIEFLALSLLELFINNPYLVRSELEDALDTPVNITEDSLKHYILLNPNHTDIFERVRL